MANRRRGEVEAELGGQKYTLVLTLGGLAELEGAFGVNDLAALGERLSAGKLSARDIICILQAGLSGSGANVDISQLPVANSLQEYARVVAELLMVTFGAEELSGQTAGALVNPSMPQT